MRWPFVSRTAFDTLDRDKAEIVARFDTLLEKYHALKLAGATERRTAPAVVPAPISPEERLLTEANEEYERNAMRALVQGGATELEARTIAKQMRKEMMDLSMTLPAYDG